MKFIICILLITGPSIIIGQLPLKSADLMKYVTEGTPIEIKIRGYKYPLTLLENGKLGENSNVIVWKAVFKGKKVAVKIVWDQESYNDEVQIYQRLGAMQDDQIEDQGIPRVHYNGKILKNYFCIIMTLMDGTLKDRFEYQNKHFDDITILLMFKRLVEVLKYIHSKSVIHNDLKPQNIFLRGPDVFIGDFDVATLDGEQNQYGSAFFASKNVFNGTDRYEMDDIESLVYTMWYLSGMEMSPHEGLALLKSWGKGAKPKMLEKCKHYIDKDVRAPIEYVCTKEIISERTKPNYDEIIRRFDDAITKVKKKTGQCEFEWLKNGSPSMPTSSQDTTTPSIIIGQLTSRTIPILSTRDQPSPSAGPSSNAGPSSLALPIVSVSSARPAPSAGASVNMPQKSSLREKLGKKIIATKLDFQLKMSKSKDKLKRIK